MRLPLPGLFALALAACGAASDAPTGPRDFTPIADLRIDPDTADLTRTADLMAVADDGTILVPQIEDGHIKAFRSGGGGPRRIGRRGEGPGEFERLTRIGTFGDTVWAVDPDLNRATLFRVDGTVVRTVPLPTSYGSVRVKDRGPGTLAIQINAQAVLPDGDLRHSVHLYPEGTMPPWAEALGASRAGVVRLTPGDARFIALIATTADHPCLSSGLLTVQFCFIPVSSEWFGGVDIARVEPITDDPGRYTIVRYRADGTTAFRDTIAFTPLAVTAHHRDSVVAKRRRDSVTIEPRFAATLPPIRRVRLGRDATVWVEEETDRPEHRWRIHDSTGTVLGTVTLPPEVSLAAAERGRVWGFTTDADGLQGIVRYRLKEER